MLKSSDMYPPDPEAIGIPEGRYNHFGQQVFYLAASRDAALAETFDDDEGIAWLQEFCLTSIADVMKLDIDIDADPESTTDVLAFGLMFSGALDRPAARPVGWRPEYLVPRFVADCAKASGFTSISFTSRRHSSRNLVLFSYSADSVVPVGDPAIRTWSTRQRPYSALGSS